MARRGEGPSGPRIIEQRESINFGNEPYEIGHLIATSGPPQQLVNDTVDDRGFFDDWLTGNPGYP
jgi:hypothetical protein